MPHKRGSFIFAVTALSIAFLSTQSRADYRVGPGLWPHADYDYAPSVIHDGNIDRFWWCGSDQPGTFKDVIYYRFVDRTTSSSSPIYKVLTPGISPAWDSLDVCDPSVVRGSFHNPYDGRTYGYAMYYTGTDNPTNNGSNGRVGVAFSNDGIGWVKYAGGPIVYPQVYPTSGYGAGQPSAYNVDQGSTIYLFHTDASTSLGSRMWVRTASDGVNFSTPTLLSNQGAFLIGNSDFGYDSQSGQFYAAIDQGFRAGDREAFSIGFYRMPAYQLLAGQGVWEHLGDIDTNLTGSYLNHSPGLGRDPYGNVGPYLPAVEAYFAQGTNVPSTWDLNWVIWQPTPSTLPFKRYYSSTYGDHWVTTGYIGPTYGFEAVLAYLFMVQQPNTRALYGCSIGKDHFVSIGADCEGQFVLGINGWLYTAPQPGIATTALYRCRQTVGDHFVSIGSNCEGNGVNEGLLGYGKAQP